MSTINKQHSAESMTNLVREHIAELTSPNARDEVAKGLILPKRESRSFQTAHGEAQGELWLFALVPNEDVALAYSDEGYSEAGKPWGIVFTSDDCYGDSGAWYSSLENLVEDCGYYQGYSLRGP
jgi:hypothetical protein